VHSPTISDHKPVCSQFTTVYKVIDPVKQKEVTQSVLEYIKNLKDNFQPKLKIMYAQEEEGVKFEGISYGDSHTQNFTLENEGDGILQFDMALGTNFGKLIGAGSLTSPSSCLTMMDIIFIYT
jgi:hypothetical protein